VTQTRSVLGWIALRPREPPGVPIQDHRRARRNRSRQHRSARVTDGLVKWHATTLPPAPARRADPSRTPRCPREGRLAGDAEGSEWMLEQGICRLETIPTSRIDSAVSEALSPWRRPLAVHDPGNIVLDLAIALALGGDCLADVNLLRAEPACSAGSPPTPPCRGWSTPSPRTSTGHSRRSNSPGHRAAESVGAGRRVRTRPQHGCVRAVDHRSRRDVGDGALGEGTRGADVQTRLRVTSEAWAHREAVIHRL
jgi:hypothetical protein